jgi:CheY-like chemotaxis protein
MRVLVVDTNQDTLDLFSSLLERWGHEVRVVSEPALALPEALEILPDIVFIDVNMLEIDGCQIAVLMRQKRALDRTLLVAVTGHGRSVDHERTHAAGFDVHLLKPVEIRDLKLLLERRPQPHLGQATGQQNGPE